jgi:signal transduction histidine kinase
MRLNRDGKLVRTDIWREGDYLDLWSVPHFLSGMSVAFALFFLDYTANAAFVIAFLVLVAYEMFEVIAKIEETRWNRVLDVVVGMASFTPTFLLLPGIPRTLAITAFIVIVILDSILSFFGWKASQKAAELEKSLRTEFEKERERFARRRAAMKRGWQKRRDQWRPRRPKDAEGLEIVKPLDLQ